MRHYELMVILDPEIEERTVAPSLDKAALEAVRGLFFRPAVYKGETYETTMQIPIKFKLN